MIIGVGTDMLEIDRVRKVYARTGERFIQRILTHNEQKELHNRIDPENYLAKQFAAKEAIAKALGTGIGQVSFQDIEILRNRKGQPQASLLNDKVKRAINCVVHLSLSDTDKVVIAFCVIEKKNE
ncbi:MAG: holo-ACP synthase [Gammaproteobacteria bacterium]|nr:holo-ACP synthase [Gammaproteobacteria bacterium]NNC96556.1 holo-ACP synthase [Gammaproteobacteria bacterium]NNM12915.1 holo-ACP synthase [Gammaproteobacteria bacterium]